MQRYFCAVHYVQGLFKCARKTRDSHGSFKDGSTEIVSFFKIYTDKTGTCLMTNKSLILSWISEQHDTSFLLTKYYSYWNVFYLVKMRNLSLVSIWSPRSLWSLRSLRKKKGSAIAAIIAIIWKLLSSDRSDNDRWDRNISISAIATIAGKWFPYDRCDRWTFFFLSDRSENMETRL